MEWGEHASKLPEDSRVILERPILLDGLDIYFNAFSDLQSERQIGMAAGSIPWYSIVKWCYFYGIHDPDNVDTFIRYIRAMEREQREYSEKRKDRHGK